MKNKIVVLTLLLVNYVLITACQPTQNVETVTPKIKTIKYYKVQPETGEKTLAYTSEHDKNGNKTKEITHNTDNSTEEVFYEYDENGNLVKVTDNEGIRVESLYENNLVIEEKTPYGKAIFEYNDKNDLISEKEYDSEGKLDKSATKKYTYDGDKIIKIETFVQRDISEEEQLEKVEVFAHNENNQVIEEKLNSVYDKRSTTYDYHSNGNLKQSIELAFDETEKIIRTYNTDGEKVQEEIYRKKTRENDFQLAQTNSWIYNEFGHLIGRKNTRNDVVISQEEMEITY